MAKSAQWTTLTASPGQRDELAGRALEMAELARSSSSGCSTFPDPYNNNDVTSSECSSVPQNSWDFTAYTVAFAKNTSVASPSPTPSSPSPTPTSSPTPTPGGCSAAGWVSNVAYVAGDVVSYGGDQWTANQWNYDEVPGGASGAWNNDGAC